MIRNHSRATFLAPSCRRRSKPAFVRNKNLASSLEYPKWKEDAEQLETWWEMQGTVLGLARRPLPVEAELGAAAGAVGGRNRRDSDAGRWRVAAWARGAGAEGIKPLWL